MDDALTARVKRHEGLRLVPYYDSLGFPTIGFGHAIQTDEHFTVITIDEAQQLLDQDITRAKNAVNRNLPWAEGLPQVVQDVIVELCFQLGIYGLLKFDNTLKCAYRHDFSGMASAMLQSLWAKQTPARAEELSQLVASAEPNGNVMPLQPLPSQPST